MRVALICHDKPGALQLRLDTRPAHRAHLESTGAVEMAGPLLDDAGEMCGSLIVLEVPDMQAARAWAEADPYAKAGLFERVELRAWNKVIG